MQKYKWNGNKLFNYDENVKYTHKSFMAYFVLSILVFSCADLHANEAYGLLGWTNQTSVYGEKSSRVSSA